MAFLLQLRVAFLPLDVLSVRARTEPCRYTLLTAHVQRFCSWAGLAFCGYADSTFGDCFARYFLQVRRGHTVGARRRFW